MSINPFIISKPTLELFILFMELVRFLKKSSRFLLIITFLHLLLTIFRVSIPKLPIFCLVIMIAIIFTSLNSLHVVLVARLPIIIINSSITFIIVFLLWTYTRIKLFFVLFLITQKCWPLFCIWFTFLFRLLLFSTFASASASVSTHFNIHRNLFVFCFNISLYLFI